LITDNDDFHGEQILPPSQPPRLSSTDFNEVNPPGMRRKSTLILNNILLSYFLDLQKYLVDLIDHERELETDPFLALYMFARKQF
jgi:hypothetical protein